MKVDLPVSDVSQQAEYVKAMAFGVEVVTDTKIGVLYQISSSQLYTTASRCIAVLPARDSDFVSNGSVCISLLYHPIMSIIPSLDAVGKGDDSTMKLAFSGLDKEHSYI